MVGSVVLGCAALFTDTKMSFFPLPKPFLLPPLPAPLHCSAVDLCRLFGVLKVRTVLDLRSEQEAAADKGDNDIAR